MIKQKLHRLFTEYLVIALIFMVSGAVFLTMDLLDTKCDIPFLYYLVYMFIIPLIILSICKMDKYEEKGV